MNKREKFFLLILGMFILFGGFFLFVLLVTNLNDKYKLGIEYPLFVNESGYTSQGDSMYPTILNGQNIKLINYRDPEVGDIVATYCNQPLCVENLYKDTGTHIILKRIIKIEGTKMWVEGDNKESSTDSRTFGWLNLSDVVGIIKPQ